MPKTTPFADLARVLRDAREAHGLSQEEAADRIGVRGRTYQRWEAGENAPRGAGTANVERVLGLEPGTITTTLGANTEPVNVQAELARSEARAASQDVAELAVRVASLMEEVDRLQGLIQAYAPPTPEQLAATVDAIVAARLAEAAVTSSAPGPRAETRREPPAKSA